MGKPRLYQTKNVPQLLKYRAELQTDKQFCDERAEQLGFGAGAEYYRIRARETLAELARIDGELAHRAAVH